MTKPLKSLKWEIEHLGTGRAPSESTPEAATYCARVIEADLRKAEAFAHVHPEMDPLQRARSLLSRGLVADAREILVKLRTNANEEGNGSSHNDLLAEVALEEARCASFEGHWQESLEWIERAFTYGPTGVSQMTLRQVRAVALMELGRLSEALSEVELAQSLARLFPKTNLSLYVTATQIKIWIFAGEAARARSRLDGLW
jgi:ATP/maltotriose-dependent transcriptional regulator MalT